jgi:sec-independent protein translocase protein TatC
MMLKDGMKRKTDNAEMHFLDHLEEFRWVLIRSVLAFLLGCGVIASFLTRVSGFLAWPLESATAQFGRELGSLVTISPMGAFTVLLQVAFLGGISLALPFILYFFAEFLAPGLTKRERRVLLPGCIAGLLLFLLGAAFSYFFILPLSIYVSLVFNDMLGYEIVWTATEYYNFVIWMILAVGGAFEFPLVLLLLQYVEIVSPERLRKIRSTVAVVIMVISAIITPSDPISMLILAAPLYLLYEVSILLGAFFLKGKRQAEQRDRERMEAGDYGNGED